eukprot:1158309-Prorocentrum_lima.AAC.1
MTSSLVGSEMCIRDRTIALRVSVSPCGNWSSGSRKWDAPLSHMAKGSESVSYTHLTLPTICSV